MTRAFDAEREIRDRELSELAAKIIDAREHLDLQEMGLADNGDHPVATSSMEFKASVDLARDRRREMGKRGSAVVGSADWRVNGSVVEGGKMIDQFSKLMLRAYNCELAALLRTTTATNADANTTVLTKKRDQITELGATMHIEIAGEYHDLAIYELRTTGLYQAAKLRDEQAERAHNAQLREQDKVRQEIAGEQARLNKQAQLHRHALEALVADGFVSSDEIAGLRARVAEIESAQAALMKRAASTRAGHVYVVSNPGSFGGGVVKIGMTRRLDPMDRVIELADGSVPFRFSVHALIFSDDAVSLEAALHHRFEPVRLNRSNRHSGFFRTTPNAVREALVDLDAHLVEFDESPINPEWEASQ